MGIHKVIKKYKIDEQPNNFSFWQSQSFLCPILGLDAFEKR